MKRPSIIAAFVAIAVLAGVIRFWGLDRRPAGLFRDEAEKGYSAWALATDGGVIEFPRDRQPPIRFKPWPYVIEVGGVTTSAVYQYASIPFVASMGLTARSTRMAAATAGVLTVALLGWVLACAWGGAQVQDQARARERERMLWTAIAAMLALAVSHWHLVFSRWAQQGIFVPLGMVGVLGGLAGAERGKRWGFPLAGAALGFTFYAYSGAQPFALLWGAALLAIYRREARAQWREAAVGGALFLASAAPMLWITFFRGGDARLDAVAIWTAADATPARTAWRFVANYLAHFNPVFLFHRGDALARHAAPEAGQLAMTDLALLPLGLSVTFVLRMPLRGALLAAFLCGPVGAAITRIGIPHALRSLPMALPCAVWSGVGLATLIDCLLQSAPSDSRSSGSSASRNPLRAFFSAYRSAWTERGGSAFCVILLAACLLSTLLSLVAYRNAAIGPEGRDPIGGFAASHREAFETAFEARAAGEKVWINAYIDPYAAYHAMFFGEIPARELAEGGFERRGIFLFDPKQAAPAEVWNRLMAPGDWMIGLAPKGEAFAKRKE